MDIDILQKNTFDISSNTSISRDINDIYAYLCKILSQMQKDEMDYMLASRILFVLGTAYGQLVKIYSSRYFYKFGEFPHFYKRWVSVLENMVSQEFYDHYDLVFKTTYLDIPITERINTVNTTEFSIMSQLGNMEYEKELVQKIDEDTYMNLESFVEKKLKNGDFTIEDDRVCVALYN